MKFLILVLVFTTTFSLCHSQNHEDTIRKVYMPLKMYKSIYKKPLTLNDSVNFIFKGNDTLVMVNNYKRPKGIEVPYEPKDSSFLYYYKKAAFNHKNDSVSQQTSMKYWKDPIRIFFSESVSRKTKKDFMSFAKTIDNAVDSLRISDVKNLEDSNYVIYYFGDYEYEFNMRNYKNSDYYLWWKHNQIYKASIKIDKDVYFSEQILQYKLREYFLQSLGYFKLIDDFDCDSYFANCFSPNKRLTNLDLELLKYHYSYGICKGTSLETFEDQHKQAQEVFKKTGHQMCFFHPFGEVQ